MNKNIKGCFEWRREVKPPRVTHGREPHQLECQAKVFLCTSPFSTQNIFYNFVLCQSNPGRYTQSHLYQYQCILKTSTYKNGTMEPRNHLKGEVRSKLIHGLTLLNDRPSQKIIFCKKKYIKILNISRAMVVQS